MSGPASEKELLAKAEAALRLVCVSLPHLSGLGRTVRLHLDPRVGTAGVTPLGRILLDPGFFGGLSLPDAAFVLAHELLHLCLRSHERGGGTDAGRWNCAHDYIINDILAADLDREVLDGALALPGARFLSGEKVAQMLKEGLISSGAPTALAAALQAAGLVPPGADGTCSSDVISAELEQEWFPAGSPVEEEELRRRIEEASAQAVSLSVLQERLETLPGMGQGHEPGEHAAIAEALRSRYQPPWEMALQQWMEAIAPGPRTYVRPSRRGAPAEAGGADLVLPGRRREGWTLHVVLDTSGSMASAIPRILGAIAA